LTSNGQRSRSRGVENVKIVFRVYLRQKWIDLRQTKTEMINGSFYTYLRIHHRKCIVSVIIVCLSVRHIPFVHSILECDTGSPTLLWAALSVARRPSVRPSRASDFLETGKPQKLLI